MFAVPSSARSLDRTRLARVLAWPLLLAVALILQIPAGCGTTPEATGDDPETVKDSESLPESGRDRTRGLRGGRGGSETGEEGGAEEGSGEDGGMFDIGDVGGLGNLGEKLETVSAEMAEIQAQLADLQVQMGDLKNFENTVRAEMEKGKASLTGVESAVGDLGSRFDGLEKQIASVGELEKSLGDLASYRKSHSDEHVELDEQVGKIPELDEAVAGMSEKVDNHTDDIRFLQDGKAPKDHIDAHETHFVKVDEFNGWVQDQYKEPQSKLWIVAVAVLSALLTGAGALFLALKAIRPAYNSMNDIRLKVNQLSARSRGDAGQEEEPL